jgi:uncharacterized protein with beta-barrel porin domain
MRQSVRLASLVEGACRQGRRGRDTITASNYADDAGHGSQTFASSQTWRNALLGTAAAGALLLGYARRAYATCTGAGATLNCTGDISASLVNGGLDVNGTIYDTLNVYTLSAPITPNSSTNGINFDTSGDITITSDAVINAPSGAGSDIFARGYGSVTITNTGDLRSETGYGIQVYNYGSGDTYVRNDGTVTTNFGTGISIRAYGDEKVVNHGVVNVTGGGGYGIGVRNYAQRNIKIYNYANVTGGNAGIFAETTGAGVVTIKSTGDVMSASGNNAITSRSSSSASAITLYSGRVYGDRFGVEFSAGTLNNSALLKGDVSAIYGGNNSTVNNSGTITGNVNGYAGGGTISAFNNLSGGTFNSGAIVSLGADTNTLTNAGTLSPGGAGTVQTTALTGKLVQTGTGTFTVDFATNTADKVTVSGTADIAGTVALNVLAAPTGSGSVVIVDAASLVSTATLLNTSGIDFTLQVQGNQLLLSWQEASILGLLIGANANQRAIAAYLDAANAAGPSAGLQALINALVALNETQLLAALNQLIPELYSDAQISSLYASLGFANNLLSCRVNGTTTASIIHEGQCLWAGASAQFLDQGTTFSQLGFNATTGLFAAGAQVALDPVWRLGFGAGYQQSSLDTATNETSDGQTALGGVALKYNPGPFLLAGVISGGRAWFDTTRPVAFTGFSGTASSNSNIDILNGGVRAAYVFGSPQLYFKPMVDAAATRLDLGGFSESGGGAANLTVASSKQTVYTIAPSLEIGTEWWMPNGTLVRPFLRGGATWYENGNLALSASFLGAPAGLTPFTIATKMDGVMGTVGAGLDVITGTDTVLHLTYDGQIGSDTQIHAIGLKGSARF